MDISINILFQKLIQTDRRSNQNQKNQEIPSLLKVAMLTLEAREKKCASSISIIKPVSQ